MRPCSLVLVASVLAASPALAQPSMVEPSMAPTVEPGPSSTKSPLLAGTLSVGGTVAGWILAAHFIANEGENGAVGLAGLSMLTVGPSLGHFYTGRSDLGVYGILARGAAMGLIVYAKGTCEQDPLLIDGEPACTHERPAMAMIGSMLFIGSMIAQGIDAPLSARRYNRAHALQVAPTVTANGGGLSLVGMF